MLQQLTFKVQTSKHNQQLISSLKFRTQQFKSQNEYLWLHENF